MPRHPLGDAHLLRLLKMAALNAPCRILDMGAGDGSSVLALRAQGFDACGIDKTGGAYVAAGDLLHCPYESGSFDAVLSECAFFACGDPQAALSEAARLLRKGGKLLIGDVCFQGEALWRSALADASFRVLSVCDITEEWKRYYLACIWDGAAEEYRTCAPGGRCRYFLTVCERRI